ncbi:hypothetical protein KORDIASMS9_00385 [Kordia sp. SMS9]|nr:hypothetical protein KORDIASMS9_00385 [Kordia sp. SMS9]
MSKFKNNLPTFLVYCILLIGGLYEILFSGNFSSYSTSGKIKSLILLALIGLLIVMYFYRDKEKKEH